jgi:hypothetical protein
MCCRRSCMTHEQRLMLRRVVCLLAHFCFDVAVLKASQESQRSEQLGTCLSVFCVGGPGRLRLDATDRAYQSH